MASQPPRRMDYPTPSVASGELYNYLQRLVSSLNQIPTASYTSYNGGPESNVTGAAGDLAVNIAGSGETSRLWIKETGSSNTGWRSATMGSVAMGDVNFNTNTVATVITTTDTWTRVAPTTSVLSMGDAFDMPANCRLRYTGAREAMIHGGCTLSLKGAGANDTFKAMLYKNGTVNANNEYTGGTQLAGGIVQFKLGGVGDVGSTAIHSMYTLATNDYVELAIKNITDADDCTATEMNIFTMGFDR